VINYLLRALDMEANLLRRRNWSWRFRPEGLRSFIPVRQHLVAEAWDNYDQFLSFHPDLKPLVDKHDSGVQALLERCSAYERALVTSEALRNQYRRMAAECPSTLSEDIARQFGPYSSEEDFIALLAEYIVNNVCELPPHYHTSRLWNHYREDLIGLRELPELRRHYEAVEAAGDDLKNAVALLGATLRDTRSSLSVTHDVPIVAEVRRSA
jgi:hypothetical protein